jgi:hypothetical protein
MPKAGGKWTLYEITAKGPTFTLVLNGAEDAGWGQDRKSASGPFALQYTRGVVKDKGVI